jgi:peptide/nickel transport system permease protein
VSDIRVPDGTEISVETALDDDVAVRHALLKEGFSSLRRSKVAMLGGFLVAVFFVVGIVGALLLLVPSWQHLYLQQNLSTTLEPPFSKGHIFGTDTFGRDMTWRVIAGTGISLYVGVTMAISSVVIGFVLGSIAGYFRGAADIGVSGLMDLAWGFPVILAAVILAGVFSPGLKVVIIAVVVVNWASFARIVRTQAASLRQREFVEAARALGVPSWLIIMKHFAPNMLGTALVMSSYYIASGVVVEASFAFIGLGAQPPTPSLGQMIATGAPFLQTDPWMAVVPGVVIALIVLGLNIFGDALRDAFDPRLRQS